MACPDGLTKGFSGLPILLRRAICHIWVDFGFDTLGSRIVRNGTGLMFRNKASGAWVVTAAHMLFHHNPDRFARHVSLKFGRDRDSFFTPIEISTNVRRHLFVTDEFIDAGEPVAEQDFGLIKVPGVPNDMLTIPLNEMEEPLARRYTVIGYPHEESGFCKGLFVPYNAIVDATDIAFDNIGYSEQTTYGGMSGGPLLSRIGSGPEIASYGLHIRGEFDQSGTIRHPERAVRFNQHNIQQMRDWLS
jgi:V8-like Glu-specific endopeptidase